MPPARARMMAAPEMDPPPKLLEHSRGRDRRKYGCPQVGKRKATKLKQAIWGNSPAVREGGSECARPGIKPTGEAKA